MACGSCSTGGGCSTEGGCSCSSGGSGCPSVQVHDWLPTATFGSDGRPSDLVEVAFKGRRKNIFRNTRNLPIYSGDYVVVGASRGVDFGYVTMTGELVHLRQKNKDQSTSYAALIRVADIKDIKRYETNQESENEVLTHARQAAQKLKLNMKLVDAEWQFDRKQLTIFFTANKRVNHKPLVLEIAKTYRTRIVLRKIGDRDEAARIGGLGVCGRELCCSTWLEEFKTVTLKAPRTQNMPLNPTRINGQCNQLKCCLNYELEQYMEALQDFPKKNTKLQTDYGKGSIVHMDIFEGTVSILYQDGHREEKKLEDARPFLEGTKKQRTGKQKSSRRKKKKSHKKPTS